MSAGRHEGGFTYVMVLIAIAVMSMALVAVSEVWVMSAKRERIAHLQWVGDQYARAIRSYFDATPGVVVKSFPQTLESLLKDPRYPFVYRHLRQLYPNPITGHHDWVVERSPNGGICAIGVAPIPERPDQPLRFGSCAEHRQQSPRSEKQQTVEQQDWQAGK